MPGTGGVRKLRWRTAGRGKRGSLRIVYYVKTSEHAIWLLTLYPKNQRATIAPHVLRQIREEVDSA
ncbi:MAG: type II toxin-antitoxin system RelE/ParE family toxin [Gammaproteobacteria bacterium]